MKKLLFFIPSLAHGGAERVMTNLANRFYLHGYDVVFLLCQKAGNEYYVNPNIKKKYLNNIDSEIRLIQNLKLITALRKEIKEEKPDVALSFLDRTNLVFLLTTLGLKTKRYSSVRSDPNEEYYNLKRKFLTKLLFPTADGIALQTSQSLEWFKNRNIKFNYRVIPNQVANEFFEKELPEKRKNIITAGRLVDCKNHEMLIRAFAKIADLTDENLVIYGEGELKDTLNNLISELGLKERVTLYGLAENIVEKIYDAKLFVLTSDFEGMPNALLEALALGIPAISTDCPCGGPREIIEDGKNGFLIPVGDVEALAEKMKYVLSLPEDKIKEISSNAKTSSEKYRPDVVFKQWEEFLIYGRISL